LPLRGGRPGLRLVTRLDLLHLRCQKLHPHHGTGAGTREREHDDHHSDGEEAIRYGVVRDQPVEKGEDVADEDEDRMQNVPMMDVPAWLCEW